MQIEETIINVSDIVNAVVADIKTRFNVDVDMTNKVGDLRMQAIGLLDQYGLE